MHPLVSIEIGKFNLLQALNRGLVPAHYLEPEYERSLRAYVLDYLKEEVFDEGLTRNVAAFSRFFEAMGYSHGDLTNYSNIARDCGVDSKTVKEYYQILVDTLLGTFVEPWKKRQERQVIGKPRSSTCSTWGWRALSPGGAFARSVGRPSGERSSTSSSWRSWLTGPTGSSITRSTSGVRRAVSRSISCSGRGRWLSR